MTVGTSNSENFCIHEASDSQLNLDEIMQFIATYVTSMYWWLSNFSSEI